MLIEKGRIARDRSFALKSSVLERALADAEIVTHTSLVHGDGRIFFDAYFWRPTFNVPYDRFYVRAGAVDRRAAPEARAFMESEVVPAFIAWARAALVVSPNSTTYHRETYFSRSYPPPRA